MALESLSQRAKTWVLVVLALLPGVVLSTGAFLEYPSPLSAYGPAGASPVLRALTPAALSAALAGHIFYRRERSDEATRRLVLVPTATLALGALAVNALRYARFSLDGATWSAACPLLVLLLPVALFNVVARRWRAEWLSLVAGLGLVGAGVGLHWTAIAFLDAARAEIGSSWPTRYYPLPVDTSGELLVGACVGALLAVVLAASSLPPRLLSWLVRSIGVVAAPLLAVTTLAARRIAWTPELSSPVIPPFMFVPADWVALGALALALGCAGFLLGAVMARWERPGTSIAPSSSGFAYRDGATGGATIAESAVEAPTRRYVARLRWEAPAVGFFCIGLAPLLAAGRAGLL